MADELGGLFDSDPGFLEELASGSRSNPGPGMIGQQGGVPPSAMIGQPGIPAQNMVRMNQMQPQQQGFGTNMGGQFPQQQQMNTGQFNQFSNQPMGQQMQMMPGQVQGQQQGQHVGQMMSPHRNTQFAQVQQQGMVLQQPQGQMQVNMARAPGPRLPNPQQQMMMGQGQGQMQNWNVQMYPQGQQPQPQGQTQYLSHHDYAVPSSNGGNSNYQNQMMGNQANFVQQMGSPQANRMPVRQTMYANQRMPFNKNFPNSQQAMTSMNSNQMIVQQQQQQQQQQMLQQNQQSGNVMQMQQFRMSANPQMQQQQAMMNSPQQNMVRFSQTSPNQGSVQHRLPFTSMPQQQRQPAPMLSPRPTPPPPSPSGSQGILSPTGSTSSNNVQSVGMPSGNTGNLFSQGANSEINLNDMTPQKQFNVRGPSPQMMSPPAGGSTNNLSQITSPGPNVGQGQVNMNASASVNSSSNNFPNGPNQTSPTNKVLSPQSMNSPPKNAQIEIQTLTQQIQQLYNMPQTQETQQKLLDLQERLRTVKSQQMLAVQRQGGQLQAGNQQQQNMTSLPNMTQQQPGQAVQQQSGTEQQQATPQQLQNQTVQQQKSLQEEQQQNAGQQQQQKDEQQQQQQNIGMQQPQQQNVQNMNLQGQQQAGLQNANAVNVAQQPNMVQQSMSNAVQQPGNMQLVTGGPVQQQPGMIRQPVPGQPGQPGMAFKINAQPGQRIQLVQPAQAGGGPQKILIIQQQQSSPQQQQQPPSSVPVPASGSPASSTQPLLKTIPQPRHVIINTSLSNGGNTQLGPRQIVQGPTLPGQAQILPNIPGVRPQRMPVPMQVQIPQQMVPVSQNVQNTMSQPQLISQPQMMQNAPMMGNPQVMGNVPPGMQHSPVPVQLQQGIQHSPVPMPMQIVPNEQENTGAVTQQQEKANKIIAEAIAKAQRTGSAIPKVMSPAELPSTLTDLDLPDSTSTPTDTPTKVKRKRKPREPKKDKSPKKKREKVKVVATDELSNVDIENSMTEDGDTEEFKEKKLKKKPGEKKPKGEKTPKFGGKKRSKPPATFLKSKKRKRRGSSDGSDMEIKFTPPPSPLDDDLKRRSGRHTKRKKYNDELDLELSDEDTMDAAPGEAEGAVVKPDNPKEEDAVVVEKILGSRMRTKDADVSNDEDEEDDVEEYYVKYKNFSYLHCEWKTEKELMKDKRIPGKIRRYKIKKAQSNFFSTMEDEELFNPDYVEVDRVLEESVTFDPNTKEEVTHYLVKWRGLPYEDSTWELQQDVDPEKVRLFKKFRELPDEEDRQFVRRPSSGSDWKALAKTHTYKNGNTLREYQLEGVNWLTFSWYKRQNCILADEMGLGKTIQSITFLQEIYNYGIHGPFLVIAPLSTIGNWMREFELWTDMNVIVYHGTSPSRFMLQEYEMYYKDSKGRKLQDFYKFHVIITTYELIISDLEVLRDINWRCVIIDEAHRLKNKNCRLMEGLRFFDFEHKVLLSGTPLQNNVEELFSLLNFLEPSQFHSSTDFLAEFGTLKTEEQVDKLKAILKPMMLRRLKEDVEKNLAAKEETIIEVELTNIQKKYYRAILEKNFSFLHKGTQSSGNVPNLMNTMMELRKCCNHPYLINGAEDNILSEMMMKQQGSSPESDPVVQAMIQASGKFVLLDKLLPKLKQSGHKVLIFSQMIRVLDILEDYLVHKRYIYERIDGRITGNLRQEAIDRFSKPDSDRFVFLLCTRAGGLGINLTAADTVIIYDSDWNPQNDLQAQARCHRIGQVNMVKVYRLITRNSYEREMFDRASMKLGLDKAVLQSMGEKVNPQAQLSKREIEELLRKGAYGALMEDDNAGDAFCEEDIDQILQRRTQVVQIESEGKGSTFAKASFSMTGNRDDIDINDPEFWEKWAKKADVNVDAGDKELIIEEPRVRKKTTRYGNDNSVVDMSDLDSSSGSDTDSRSTKGRKGRGRRKGDEDTDFESEKHFAKSHGPGYGRSELFKVEKGLLVYGWGRWTDIVTHANWKRHMEEKDVEKVSRAILIYSLGHYKGDERIKEFIWDLVSPSGETVLKNHSGLSAPVPRGRKGRRKDGKEVKEKEDPKSFKTEDAIAECKVDPNIVLGDNGYKKHLHRHSNKVLLRVRTLYYLKHEVLGQAAEAIAKGVSVADINIPLPVVDVDPPAYWWDNEADKSLLVGVYKHGYEKYNLMRQDQTLTFLARCGPPDSAALAKEMKDDDDDEDKVNDDEDESVLSTSDVTSKKPSGEAQAPEEGEGEEGEKLPFPTVSDLNTRLRRIITNYQRDYKRQQQKKEAQAKKIEKRGKLDAMVRERELRRRETQQRWVRREETDFYRIVSTYGIEFDRHKGRYIWDKFRQMAKLDKKTDEQLTEYFISFYHMCLRVCRKIKEDAYPPTPLYVEAITEERASRCIARIDLLSKIREEIIVHNKLRERIMLCKTSYDLPTWWINGFHDRELLIGAAKHGLAKTETYILGDPNFSFQKYCKLPEPTSQPNSPANFKLFGKDIGKVKDETDSVKEEKSESKEGVKSESKEDDPATPSNPLDEDDEDTSEYHQDMLDSIAQNGQDEAQDKTENRQEEGKDKSRNEQKECEKDKTDNKKEPDKERSPDKNEEKDRTKTEKVEHETKIKVSDFIKKEVEKLTDSGNDAKVKKENVNSDDEDGKIVVNSEKESDKDVIKKEHSGDDDPKSKGEEGECSKVSVKKEVKSDPRGDEEDEEVRRTFEEGESAKLDFLNKVKDGLSTHWPKDRIVFHRLEHICYCIETGEWPFGKKMPNPHILGIDSGSATPTSSRTPTLTPKAEEEPVQALQEMMKAKTKQEKDFEVQLSEGDGLKLTFHKRAKEKERRQVESLEADKAKIQQILAQSAAASTASSDESRPNSTLSTSQTPDSLFMNGSPSAEAELLMNQSLLEQSLLLQGRRRGRKRKEEKMAEIAMAEALARRQMARAVASFEPDSRVPVINLEDGSRLTGDKAPLKKDLDAWLDTHPGYIIDRIDDELEEGEIISDYSERRRGRKPKVDPAFLSVDTLTGEENVSVINRLTGKKITGAKAPPLRYLAEWLEQNPMWDVDPKWSDLVKAKGSLPKQLLPRVVTPNRRGRGRPARDSPPISHSMLGTSDPHAAAAMAATLEAMNAAQLMAAGFPKLPLPFASLPPGLGLSNPLLGLSGLGIPGFPTTPPLSSKDSDSKRKDLEDKEGSKGDSKSPHPSFPMMYNPLLYNPLLAAQGLGGFPLPTSLSSPGLSSRLINGHGQSDSEDEPKLSRSRRTSERVEQNEAEDLSVRSDKKVIENLHEAHSSGKHKPEPVMDDSEQPCDLSMKSKSKEETGTKIIASDKLSKIVDSLKDRVNKMDGKPVSSLSEKTKEGKKSKLDSLLFSLASQEKSSGAADLTSPSFDRRPSSSSASSSDRRSSLTSPTSDRRSSLTSLILDRQSSSSERRPSVSDKHSDRTSSSKLLTSHSDTILSRKSSLSSPLSLTSSSGVKPSTKELGVKHSTKEPVPQIVQELLAAKQLKDAAKLQKEMDLAAKQQRAIEALVAKQRQMEEVFFMKRSSTDSKLLKDSKEKASTSERIEKEGSSGRPVTKEDKS